MIFTTKFYATILDMYPFQIFYKIFYNYFSASQKREHRFAGFLEQTFPGLAALVLLCGVVLFLGTAQVAAQPAKDSKNNKDKKIDTTYRPDDADKGMKKEFKRVGTVTFTLQGGVQNITNHLEHSTTGERRDIIIDDFGALYYTVILGLRFGTHAQGWENINNGFRYNRSNKGFFTDFEFGIKTYNFGGKTADYAYYPTQFTIQHAGGPNTLTDRLGNVVDSHVITLAERTKVGDNMVAIFPWQTVVGGQVVDDPSYDPLLNDKDDLYHIMGINTGDTNVRQMLESHGAAATKSMTIFINSYYHFNFFHWMFGLVGLDLGTVFDSSIGLSFRLNRYVDITDFNRFVSYNNDNFTGNIGVITRNYINFGKKLRTKLSYMFPIVGFFVNRLQMDDLNAEEHIAEIAVEYYAVSYIYLSVGFQYSYYPFNSKSAESVIRTQPEGGDAEVIDGLRPVGRGIVFTDGQYNHGFNQIRRDAWEIYFAVSFDLNL